MEYVVSKWRPLPIYFIEHSDIKTCQKAHEAVTDTLSRLDIHTHKIGHVISLIYKRNYAKKKQKFKE
jgi:hypothetical protein